LGNKGLLKVLNGTKLILDDHGNMLDSFRIILESFRSFRGSLLPKPVTCQEISFAISYNKPALVYVLFGQNIMHSTLDFNARSARKDLHVQVINYEIVVNFVPYQP
jgi:hypothetical protein